MQHSRSGFRGSLQRRGCLLSALAAVCGIALLLALLFTENASRDSTPTPRDSQAFTGHASRDSADSPRFVTTREPRDASQSPLLRCGMESEAVLARHLPQGSVVSSRTTPLTWQHRREESSFAPALPSRVPPRLQDVACPMDERLRNLDAHEEDLNVEQRTSHITFKYNYYATRCNRTSGIMWRHLTLPVMREVTSRVVRLLSKLYYFNDHMEDRPIATYTDPSGTGATSEPTRHALSVLDWASGCGAGTQEMHRAILQEAPSASVAGHPSVAILGLELIKGAVDYAEANYATNGTVPGDVLRFCQADGTKLHWIPDGSVDWIVSFGGLLHLPTSNNVMCRTIQQLLEKLSVGGVLWTGYVDQATTLQALISCSVTLPRWAGTSSRCMGGGAMPSLTVTVIRENVWWGNIGVSKVYRRRKPKSIVWQKVGW